MTMSTTRSARSLWISGSLLVVAVMCLGARQFVDASAFRLDLDEGVYTFEVHEDGGELLDFVLLIGPALDVTFRYEHHELAGQRIDMVGTLTFPEEDLLAFAETMLDGSGLNMVDTSFGAGGYVELLARRRLLNRVQNGGQDMASWAPMVDLDALEAWRHRRRLISVIIPLEHVDAGDIVGAAIQLVDFQLGIVRAVQPGNVLFLVERADVVCRLVDLLHELDVPRSPDGLAMKYASRQADVQSALRELELRVAELER